MGLLSKGRPLGWHPSSSYRQKVKLDGIDQFLNVFHAAKNFKHYDLCWGDEVEYLLLHLDHENEKATLALRAPALLNILQQEEHARPSGSSVPILWRPEYAAWMLEGTPGVPYRCFAADLVNVHRNMALRRAEILRLLKPSETVSTLTAFPLAGCGTFTTPPSLPFGPIARSFFVSDDVINPHPRFRTLTRNIRARRGRKVQIEVPLFIDENTQVCQPLIPRNNEHLSLLKTVSERMISQGKADDPDLALLEDGLQTHVDGKIIMDCAAFGMGSCCLQVTMQGRDLSETRYLYDQLAVMAPIMLAITAATPALRGLLADTDVRWDVISASMDDRTDEEILSNRVPKSRYSSIDCYLSCREKCQPEMYNDLDIPINNEAYKKLRNGGVDHLLAQHIAHLFIRDPLVIFEDKVHLDNSVETDHFENIQSTNWNTVRFKPPPPGTGIGWRTEFRSMEVGLTDFENAAFSVFIVILSRVILAFKLNFYIPMSKVDENMESAHMRDAVGGEKFYFRKNILNGCDCSEIINGRVELNGINEFGSENAGTSGSSSDPSKDACELMSLDEIFNGKPSHVNGTEEGPTFPGLVPLMRGYLDALNIDDSTREQLLKYLNFVADRAAGKIPTAASYIRSFLMGHEYYRGDSVVNEKMCYDLIRHLQEISEGTGSVADFLGQYADEVKLRDIDTPSTMMARMQAEFEGLQGGLLLGSSMPPSTSRKTIDRVASKGRL